MSPRLSHLNVAMAHRNYFRRNNLQILKLATYIQRLESAILGANWQLFRLERIAKCSYSILSTQNIKFYWFVMKIKKFLLPIWWYNTGLFPLGNEYFWVFVLKWVKCANLHLFVLMHRSVALSVFLCAKIRVQITYIRTEINMQNKWSKSKFPRLTQNLCYLLTKLQLEKQSNIFFLKQISVQ